MSREKSLFIWPRLALFDAIKSDLEVSDLAQLLSDLV